MLETLISLDHSLFRATNAVHWPWLDEVMYWAGKREVWAPLYLFVLYRTGKRFGFQSAGILVGAALMMIFVTDQVSSSLLKPGFHRLRPCHVMEGVHLLHEYCGGQFGFVSSHAANFAGMAGLLFVLLRKSERILVASFFALAFLMCWQRVYAGVHYPGDVVCGGVFGAIVGVAAGLIARRVFVGRFERGGSV